MKHIIIGERYRSLIETPLNELGFDVLGLPDNPDINECLSGHSDLSCFYYESLFLAPYLNGSDFAEKLGELGTETAFPSVKQSKKYPNDVQFNVFYNKFAIICNQKTVSDEIVKRLTNDRELISVNQGYANCCCLGVGERGLITSDSGIYNAALESGLFDNPLLISQGSVSLPGFDYGFIGGSAINLDESTIAFTGRLDYHPDKTLILDYFFDNNVEPVFLTDLELFDIGGAIII